MYRSAKKWHPDAQGGKWLAIKMWLSGWFVFFLLFSSVQCWVNKWPIQTCECTAPPLPPPSAGETPARLSGVSSISEKSSFLWISGQTSDDHSSVTLSPMWLTTDLCLKQHAENKTKIQKDSDCVAGHRYHTSWDWLRNQGDNILDTES